MRRTGPDHGHADGSRGPCAGGGPGEALPEGAHRARPPRAGPTVSDGPPYKRASSLFGLAPFENIYLKLDAAHLWRRAEGPGDRGDVLSPGWWKSSAATAWRGDRTSRPRKASSAPCSEWRRSASPACRRKTRPGSLQGRPNAYILHWHSATGGRSCARVTWRTPHGPPTQPTSAIEWSKTVVQSSCLCATSARPSGCAAWTAAARACCRC